MAEGQSEHESWPEGSRLGGLVEASVPNPVQGKKRKRKREKGKQGPGASERRWEIKEKEMEGLELGGHPDHNSLINSVWWER